MKNLYKSRNSSSQFLKFFASLAVLFIFAGGQASAQLDTEFWFAPPELTEAINPGTDGPRDRPIQLVISTLEKAAKVEILKPADASFTTIVENIPANSTRIVNLTPYINSLESKPENTVLNTGLFIRSTQSISAYYEIKSANNTDLFALKGLNANGKKFFVPFQTHWNNSLRKGPGGGFYNPTTYASFDIVATDDSTYVTVTPSKDLVGHLAGQPFTFMLNRGQVYSCRAGDRFGINHPAGSQIESTKPVAVTMKDDMLQFDINEQAAGADIAGDQLIPVEFLGTNYVLVKGGLNGNNDRCYILATEDETVIRFNGSAQAADTLNVGEQFELVMTNPSYFLSTNGKKVAVLHLSGINDQLAGAVIPSLSCTGTNRIGFTRTTSNTFIINVITKLSAIGKFTLNGNSNLVPASAFTAIQGGNGWAFARITLSTSQVPAGTTLLLQNSSKELFHLGVTNYAAGVGSNYGYFSNFSKLNLGVVKNVCTGDTAVLDAGPAKTSYLWSTGDTSRTIETLIPGRYWVTTLSGTECLKSDTVTVRFYSPNFDLGADDTICIGSSKLLEPDGVFTYKWQDGSTATTYVVTQAGLYWAQVADFQGCSVRDSVNIFASPRPITPTASGSDTVCAGNSVALSMNLVSNAFYNWYDPNGNRIPGRNIAVNTATQPVGAYKGAIKVKGCESFYDTAYVGLKDGIPVDLGKDTVLCLVSGSLLLDPVAHEPGFQYLWNNGSTDTNLVVTSSGSYSVRVTDLQGCTSFDTIIVTFQGPTGNVVLSGPSNFCENEPAVFGVIESPGTIYIWTGPNGFSFTGPTISFDQIQISQAGAYSVTPSLNTCSGNSVDKTITVNPFPIVDLGKDSSACGAFSLLLDPVNGGSQGLSFLWNNGSTDSSITATTQGTYSVTVSNGTCSATDEMVITFGVGPQTVTFTGSRTYCEAQNASFGVVPNDGETYSWTGPNGFTATGASINLPAVTQNQAGTYFVTPSLPGCPGAQSQTKLTVNSVPQIPGMKDTSFCAGSTIILDPVPFGNGEIFYTWNTGSTDSTLTVGTVGKYSVIIDNGFCKAYDTVLVGSRPLPSAPTFFGNNQACLGSNVEFGVQQVIGQTHAWTGPGSFNLIGDTIRFQNINNTQFGSYSVVAILNNCASASSSFTLNQLSTPQIQLPESASICSGNSVLLDPGNFGSGVTYLWSNGNTDSTLLVTQPGLVTVTVSNGTCSATDQIQIETGSTPSPLVISGNSQVCAGSSINLSVNPENGVDVTWSGPNGFTAAGNNINLENLQPNQSGNYIASQVLAGCIGQGDTAVVNILLIPSPDLPQSVSVCDGIAVELDPIAAGAGFTYLWTNGFVDSAIAVSTAGLVKVTVSNQFCSASDSVLIIISETPSLATISGASQNCAGTDVVLNANAQAGTSLSWTGPNGFTATGSSITINNIQANQAGEYFLSQELSGCPGIGDSISIVVFPTPAPDLGTQVVVCSGTPVLLDPGLNGSNLSYLWNTGSTDSSITVSEGGKYYVTVTQGTCSGTDSIDVIVGQNPETIVVSGPTEACEGSNVVFTSNASAGTDVNWTGPAGFTSSGSSISLNNIQILQSGLYIIEQSLNGCGGIGDSINITVHPIPKPDLGGDVSVCDGTPVLLNSGLGNSGYTFIWNTGSTDSSIIVSDAGTYSVTVRNANCSSKDSVLVQVGQTPSPLSITGPVEVCAGADVVLSSNAGAGVSLVWSGPNGFSSTALSVSFTNVQQAQAGEYILNQSLNGCDGLGDTLVLAVLNTPFANLGADVSICGGVPVVLDPVAFGSSGYGFSWNTGSTDSSIVVNQSGTYSVVVNNGICSSTDSVLVTLGEVPSPIVISGETTYCSGSDALISSNAQAGVSLVWSGPNGFTSSDSSISFTNLQAAQTGSYIVTQSLNGCPGTGDTLNISVLLAPQADLGQNASICDGSPILLDPVTSGNGFTYLWSNGSTDSSITATQTGEYFVTVSNQICQSSDTIQVSIGTTPAPMVISGTPEACQGTDISFSTNASAGVTVNWTGPSNFSFTGSSLLLANVQNNQAGTYYAVPSNNGCVGVSDSIVVSINSSPQIELGQTVAVCNGSQVTLDPIVGAQGLTFQWSNGFTDSSIVVSTAGMYSVVVSDGGFCPATDSIEVIDGVPPPSIPIAGDSVYCLGSTAVFAMPNLGQISYSWSGPAGFTSDSDTLVIPNLTAANSGIYTVTPTLGNCPGATSSISLIIGPDLQINLGNNDTICGDEPVLLDPLNGAAWYTYQWNVGSTDSVILATESGVYSVTVRNQGCVKTDSVELTFIPLPSTVTISGNASYCFGTAIDLSIQGAEAGVQYLWTGPAGLSQTGDSINIASASLGNSGTYQVTPSKGTCLGTPTSLDITVYQSPQVNLGQDIQSCEGNTITLDPTQNGPGYIYLWNTGSTDSSINVNSTGQYSVEVSNGTICTTRDTINIEFFVQPSTPVISGDFIYCEGENAQFAASLQTGVNVSWTGPNGFSSIGNQVAIPGISISQSGYFKVVAFSPGCIGTTDSVLIQVSGSPSLELGADTTACSGAPVILSAITGSGLNYQWTGGANTPTISVSGSGTYYLTVTNTGLCSATDSIGVTIKPSPEPLEILSGSKSICSNETVIFSVVSRDNEVYNWTGPFSFSEQGDSIQLVGGTALGGTYTVTADRDGCKGSPLSVTLGIKPNPTLSVDYPAQVCKGAQKTATATASDGSFILWSNSVSGPSNQLSVGFHWVSASLNGCSVSDTFLISNAGPLAAFTSNPDTLLEVYKEIKFIDQSVKGLSTIASWNWNLGYSGQSTDQNPSRTYNFEGPVDVSLIVTDQAGCSDTVNRSLLIGPPIGWFIPNLFTPNGDKLNDLFFIRDLDKFPGTYLRIVNRWGKVETEVNDYKNDWSGDNLEDGIYYYNIKRGVDGQNFSGFVELKR